MKPSTLPDSRTKTTFFSGYSVTRSRASSPRKMMSRISPLGVRLTMLHLAMPGTNGSAFSAFITSPFQMSLRLNFGCPSEIPSFAATSRET
jgi:hypothetical protein